MTIDFNLLARIAKLVALFGFLLPWVAVSCSGTEIMTGTGVQLMTGDLQLSGPLAAMQEQATQGQAQEEMDKPDPSIFVIAAAAAIVIGLAISLFTRKRAAAAVLLAFSVAAIGLSYYSVEHIQREMTREMAEQQGGAAAEMGADPNMDPNMAQGMNDMSQAMQGAIQVEKKNGYWVTIIALIVGAVFALLTLATRVTPATKPEAPAA